ncbi:MAG TPA: hypothetical protein VG755_19565 [Nannocystaceae bacterium]|nr:hypothetical protein [Nannocystaceae bacterium]
MRVIEFFGPEGDHYGLALASEADRVAQPGWVVIDPDLATHLLALSPLQLRDLWREAGSTAAWGDEPPDADELERWVKAELAEPTGRLVMWRTREPLHGAAVPLADAAPMLSELLSSEPEEVKTWVAFRLLDLAGDPIPDVRFEITLSDGSIEDGTTDGDGAARLDDIVAGPCSIEFPDLPETFWEHEHNSA